MHHAGTREPAIGKRIKARPRDAVPVATTPKSVVPVPEHLRPEGEHAIQVAGNGMIVHVPVHHTAEPVRQSAAVMHVPTHMLLDGLEFGARPLGVRLASHGEAVPLAGTPADVGEPEEIEGRRLPLPRGRSGRARHDGRTRSGGSCRGGGETEAFKAILKVSQESLSLIAVLEPKDEIVGVAHDDHIAGGMTTSPLMCPQVQDVVEVHIGKQRRDHRALECTYRRLGPLAVLGHSCPEPLTDQAQDPRVCDSVLEEFDQPSVVEGVEKATDVRTEHPVHPPLGQTGVQRVQRVMRAATEPEPVGKSEEVHLKDGVEDRHRCVLDDLVLR